MKPLVDTTPGAKTLLNALSHGQPPDICAAEGVGWIEKVARVLSRIVHDAVPKFTGHGTCGVFGEKSMTKVNFMHDTICKVQQKVNTVCELGFNAGHSSLLFLLTVPNARVISFDLGDIPWARWGGALLNTTHGHRFEYVMGNSAVTIPKYAKAHPEVKCDLLLIDGGKEYNLRKADLNNFRTMSNTGSTLLFDEVCQEDCVRGANRSNICDTCWNGCTKAYARAAATGLLKIDECAMVRETGDGMCSAVYL